MRDLEQAAEAHAEKTAQASNPVTETKAPRKPARALTTRATAKTELREPSDRERHEGREAGKRLLTRRKRPEVGPFKPESKSIQPAHSEEGIWRAHLHDAFGSTSHDFVTRGLSNLTTAMQRKGQSDPTQGLNAGLAVLGGLQPENEIEAMLAMQMAATHEAAMDMLATARASTMLPTLGTCGNLAVKLLRAYTQQAEALAKLRRGGEQTVRVEHVHVHPGAQAIVGNVQHGGGGSQQNGNQPHAPIDPKALAFAPGPPLWSEDEGRDLVPVASREWED
ncbi:hypothetical protein [Microvirga ossetica]|uniref:hypothetical protein n=1 Tax=Microvirga ossetica TaxID=1882682 RepID=UPI0013000F1B|nr:hypothetical protein [Microvirga ossetica]